MTDRELLQQALDALKKHDDKWLECGERVWFEEEIKAIGERLAQPESIRFGIRGGLADDCQTKRNT